MQGSYLLVYSESNNKSWTSFYLKSYFDILQIRITSIHCFSIQPHPFPGKSSSNTVSSAQKDEVQVMFVYLIEK